jgi:beta-galactosidase
LAFSVWRSPFGVRRSAFGVRRSSGYHPGMRQLVAGIVALLLAPSVLSSSSRSPSAPQEHFPIAVWYGGGTARAPMLEPAPRAKKEAWRSDVRQIKALGFTAIRCWIDWASGEREQGRYTLDTLDVLLELAEEEGVHVILQVYMDSAPAWIGRAHPDARFVSSGGQVIQPESAPGYCVDHEAVRRAEVAFYGALAGRLARSSAAIGIDLWSEPHVVNWATPTYIDRPEFCFCASTVRKFRGWLQRKYGSLDALNAAWYRQFASWDEVEPGRLSTILSYADYIDWKAFVRDKLADDLRARYTAVKTVAPRLAVVSHAAGVGLFASPHWWEGQSDDWQMASQVDFYGTSFYPKHSAFVDRGAEWRAALLDFTRSFAWDEGRRGFWVGEMQAGFGTIALNVSPTVTASDLRAWAWSAIARGARGLAYYAYYPMSTGYESGGFGLVQLDGTLTERAKAAGAIGRVVARHEAWLLESRPASARVAVVYNPLAHFVGGRQRDTAYGGPQGEVAGVERDSLLGVHRALFGLGVDVDYVHADRVGSAQLSRYALVYLPYPVMLPSRLGPVLREYVAGGGSLAAEARLAWTTERGRAESTIPGLGLAEVFGCRETDVQTGDKGRTTLTWSDDGPGELASGTVVAGRWFEETLEPLGASARVVARFADGRGAAVASTFGKGKTLALGTLVSAAYQARPDESTAAFFKAVLAWAGVEIAAPVDAERAEVRTLERGPDRLLTVFNHAPVERDLTVAVSRDGVTVRARDIEKGSDVPVSSAGGRQSVTVRVGPGDVRVVMVTPR